MAALLDETNSWRVLRRFTNILVAVGTGLLLLFVLTPLSAFWFGTISALGVDLTNLAVSGLWLALPLPALTTLQSWYQGGIMFGRKTRGITESVVLFLLISLIMLTLGVIWGGLTGLYIGMLTSLVSATCQTARLSWRARPIMAQLAARDLP